MWTPLSMSEAMEKQGRHDVDFKNNNQPAGTIL